MPLLAVKSIC